MFTMVDFRLNRQTEVSIYDIPNVMLPIFNESIVFVPPDIFELVMSLMDYADSF
jgi:hypothetical protein